MDQTAVLMCLAFAIGYLVGRIITQRTIKHLIVEDDDVKTADLAQEKRNFDNLKLEKIGDQYYAYVGERFVGQSNNLTELFRSISKNKSVPGFNLQNTFKEFTSVERENIVKALLEIYAAGRSQTEIEQDLKRLKKVIEG